MNTSDSTPSPLPPTPEQIGQRAREIWRERGEPSGQDVEIWLEAERQLATPDAGTTTAAPAATAPTPSPASPVVPPVRRSGTKKVKTGGKSLTEKVQDSLPRGGYGTGGPLDLGQGKP